MYSHDFFEGHQGPSSASAEAVVPLVMDWVAPASVVDVGCGRGAWLAAFVRHGVTDILGIDGDYVDRASLSIPPDAFRAADLTRPLNVGRAFDLAVSLEVAEHLPASSAEVFIATLAELAPVVLFSAASPYQGGTHHVNERWPAYWAERFGRHGYRALDILRPRIWGRPEVASWYQQNAVVYARPEALAAHPKLSAARVYDGPPIGCLHPERALASFELTLHHVGQARPRDLLAALPGAIGRAVRKRLPR